MRIVHFQLSISMADIIKSVFVWRLFINVTVENAYSITFKYTYWKFHLDDSFIETPTIRSAIPMSKYFSSSTWLDPIDSGYHILLDIWYLLNFCWSNNKYESLFLFVAQKDTNFLNAISFYSCLNFNSYFCEQNCISVV